jgi:hypothetical protein
VCWLSHCRSCSNHYRLNQPGMGCWLICRIWRSGIGPVDSVPTDELCRTDRPRGEHSAIGVNLRLKCPRNLAVTSCVRPLNPPILGDFENESRSIKPLRYREISRSKSPRIGGFRGRIMLDEAFIHKPSDLKLTPMAFRALGVGVLSRNADRFIVNIRRCVGDNGTLLNTHASMGFRLFSGGDRGLLYPAFFLMMGLEIIGP